MLNCDQSYNVGFEPWEMIRIMRANTHFLQCAAESEEVELLEEDVVWYCLWMEDCIARIMKAVDGEDHELPEHKLSQADLQCPNKE